jgi:hypothetical protein
MKTKIEELESIFVESKIYYFKDSAYLNDNAIESEFEFDDQEQYANLFDKAIEYAESYLTGFEFIEIESQGDYNRAIWHKIS